MRYPSPLLAGVLMKRYKRFLADIRLDTGEEITAHCANPGSMMGLNAPGARVWVSTSDNPKRKLKHTWELVRTTDNEIAAINANRPNALVGEALEAGLIPAFTGYGSIRREVKYRERSRVDFLLEGPDRPPCYLEVKNVHMMRTPGLAEFPDSVTARGARHMGDLAAMADEGARAAVLFVVQMTGPERMGLARDIDPGYAAAFDAAMARGVEAHCHACRISAPDAAPDPVKPEITLDRALPMIDTAHSHL